MISLLMPTMNRSEFVIRLLNYYARLNFKHRIFIGDSSNPEEFEKTSRAVRLLKNSLKVEHYHCPRVNNYIAVEQLLGKVITPYAIFLPDDDFFVPDSIEKCIRFLENNPDYSCAWGKTVMFKLEKDGAYGRLHALSGANKGLNNSVTGESVKERICFHARHYAAVFVGVCRTGMLKKALRNSQALFNTAKSKEFEWGTTPFSAFSEVLTSFSMLVQGKGKSLDCLYWIRHAHDRRYLFPTCFDWMISPNWLDCNKIVRRQITEDIMEKEGCCVNDAEMIWKTALEIYIGLAFYNWFGNNTVLPKTVSKREKLKIKIKKIPSLYSLLLSLRKGYQITMLRLFKSDQVTLHTILSPSSRNHKDFMPVYRLVTRGISVVEESGDGKGFVKDGSYC